MRLYITNLNEHKISDEDAAIKYVIDGLTKITIDIMNCKDDFFNATWSREHFIEIRLKTLGIDIIDFQFRIKPVEFHYIFYYIIECKYNDVSLALDYDVNYYPLTETSTNTSYSPGKLYVDIYNIGDRPVNAFINKRLRYLEHEEFFK